MNEPKRIALDALRALRARALRMRAGLFALAGLAGVDLFALNAWAVPALHNITDVSALSRARDLAPAARERTIANEPVAPHSTAASDQEHAVAARDTSAIASAPTRLIYFGTGTWWVGPSGHKQLLEMTHELKDNTHKLVVIGHADAPGARDLNQRISEERARAVARQLIGLGVDPARVAVRAVGEDEPGGIGNDRRVEVRLEGGP
jgi:outer membrane protein OmpA-like peptidoglycan-associated protein